MSVLGPFRLAWILSHLHPHANLRERAHSLPDVRQELVDPLVEAALEGETADVPAELLVSLAWSESRFEPRVRTGRACGVMQVIPADLGMPRSACSAWESDVREAVRAGTLEIEMELRDPRVHGDLRMALLYRACGNAAFRPKRCRKGWYVSAAMRRAERLGLPPAPTSGPARDRTPRRSPRRRSQPPPSS